MPLRQRKVLTSLNPIFFTGTYLNGIASSHGGKDINLTRPGGTSDIVSGPNHRLPSRRKKGKKIIFRDFGGSVDISHNSRTYTSREYDLWNKPNYGVGVASRYRGFMTPSGATGIPGFATTYPAALNESVLVAKGTEGWAKFKPTASNGQLGQALGELHDLPNLGRILAYKNALKQAGKNTNWKQLGKDTGHNYLNVVFGWVPLVHDIRDMIHNMTHLNERLHQLLRDNGRPVRRSGSVGTTSTTSSVTTVGTPGQFLPVSFAAGMLIGNCVQTVSHLDITDYKFSARFRYFIDERRLMDLNNAEVLQFTRIATGLEVSPYVLYQLMPWSWLIDWFTNTGSVIDNLSHDSQDHLVADYAYINAKSRAYTRTDVFQLAQYTTDGKPLELFCTKEDETVYFRRRKATPFGFGLTMDGLNLKQLAILAALGLTKIR